MKLKVLLRFLITEQTGDGLEEAAVSLDQVTSQGLALGFFGNDGNVLFKPDVILDAINSLGDSKKITDKGLERLILDSGALVGAIGTEVELKGVHRVWISSAERGYGPLMYDIALSNVYPERLKCDNVAVSPSAQNIWYYYFNKRPDVNKALISFKNSKRRKELGYLTGYVAVANPNETQRKLLKDLKKFEDKYKAFHKREQTQELWNHDYYKNSRDPHRKQQLANFPALTPQEQEVYSSIEPQYNKLLKQYNDSIKINPMAYSYQINKPLSTSGFLANYDKFEKQLMTIASAKIKSFEQFENALDAAAQKYANKKVRDGAEEH